MSLRPNFSASQPAARQASAAHITTALERWDICAVVKRPRLPGYSSAGPMYGKAGPMMVPPKSKSSPPQPAMTSR
jgi:hypothetical protein